MQSGGMQKREDAFRSIGEVASLIGVAPHVLRYWETQFPQLKPMKRPDGRRYYRPDDLRLAAGLCVLLRDDGLTIRGAKKLIAQDRGESVRARGDARLQKTGDLDTPILEQAAEASDPPPPPPAEAPPPAPEPAAPPPQAEPQDEDMPFPQDDEDEPAPQPHARHRHRRRHAAEGQMPLFDGPPPPEADWLPRLTRLGRLLAAQSPEDARWQKAAPAGLRLGQAIARLY